MEWLQKLKLLEEESMARKIPILGSDKGTWLYQKVKEVKPKKILEIGTANGYSGIILGSSGAELITIEINEKIAEEARNNFIKFKIKAQILLGSGVELVHELAEKNNKYNLIFIDFAKKEYINILESCVKIISPKGWIIADNINKEKCQNFKYAVLDHPQLKTEIINIKDGLSCSRKI